MKVINVVSQKGGCGKTETVKNLSFGFAKAGKRTLVIDLDPQANATSIILKTRKPLDKESASIIKKDFDSMQNRNGLEGIELLHKHVKRFSSHLDSSTVLESPERIRETIQKTDYNNLDIIPATSKLIEIDLVLKTKSFIGGESKLAEALKLIENDYDVVIIDNSPFINAITINGITACNHENDLVLIPITIEEANLEGTDAILQQMLEILKYRFLGFDFKLLFTMRNRNSIEAEVESLLRHIFPESCFNTKIRYQANPIRKASFNKEILIDKSRSNVSKDYKDLVEECLNTLF